MPITRPQMALARRSPDWGPDDPVPSARKTSSKDLGNLASRSRIKSLTGVVRSDSSELTLRACQRSMPAQQCCWLDEAAFAPWLGKRARKTREDGPVGRFERRSCDLAAQDGNLVTQQRDLDRQFAALASEPTDDGEQAAERLVEEAESHGPGILVSVDGSHESPALGHDRVSGPLRHLPPARTRCATARRNAASYLGRPTTSPKEIARWSP